MERNLIAAAKAAAGYSGKVLAMSTEAVYMVADGHHEYYALENTRDGYRPTTPWWKPSIIPTLVPLRSGTAVAVLATYPSEKILTVFYRP